MRINPQLNLNKTPQECELNSIVCAKNMMLNDSGSFLTQEGAVVPYFDCNLDVVNSIGEQIYTEESNKGQIVGVIESYKELIVFVYRGDGNNYIYRIDSLTDKLVENRSETSNINDIYDWNNNYWKWSGGKVFGSAFYNYKDELIINVGEYGDDEQQASVDYIPYKSWNLHKSLASSKSINIEPILPRYNSNYEILAGGDLITGVYTFFIRFKINSNGDYTKWDQITDDIIINNFYSHNAIHHIYQLITETSNNDSYKAQHIETDNFADFYINKIGHSNYIILLKLDFLDADLFDSFQIGYIFKEESNVVGRILNTFSLNNSSVSIYVYDNTYLEEVSIDELLLIHNQPFNVKSSLIYENQNYIANYDEYPIYKINPQVEVNVCSKNIDEENNDDDISDENVEYINIRIENNPAEDGDKEKMFWTSIYLTNVAVTKDSENNYHIKNIDEFFKNIASKIITKFTTTVDGKSKSFNFHYDVGYKYDWTTDPKIQYFVPAIIVSKNTSVYGSIFNIAYIADKYKMVNRSLIVGNEEYDLSNDTTVMNRGNFLEYGTPKVYTVSDIYNQIKYKTSQFASDSKIIDIKYDKDSELLTITNSDGYEYIVNETKNCGIHPIVFEIMYCDTAINTTLLSSLLTYNVGIQWFAVTNLNTLVEYSKPDDWQRTKYQGGSNSSITKYIVSDKGGSCVVTYNYSLANNDPLDLENNTNRTLIPEQYYNLFIHYIREDGSYTNGYPIDFDTIDYENNKTIYGINVNADYSNYIGYFITYEEVCENVDYFCKCKEENYVTNTKLIYDNIKFKASDEKLRYSCETYIEPRAYYISDKDYIVNDDYKYNQNKEIKTLYRLTPNVYNESLINNYYFLPGYLNKEKVISFNKPIIISATSSVITDVNSADCSFYEIMLDNSLNYNSYPLNSYNVKQDFEQGVVTLLDKDQKLIGSYTNYIIAPNKLPDFLEIKACYTAKPSKTYTNYRDSYVTEFKQTIKRSATLGNESLVNNFRIFENEQYKYIEQNFGEIINLVAVNTFFFVHTKYSLLLIDRTNQLTDKVKLSTPDTFARGAQSIIPSDKGYGGLRMREESIMTNHGYVWFDYYNKMIFLYDSKLTLLNKDINKIIKTLDIDTIRFAEDLDRNRLLICIHLNNKIETTDFNYTLTLSYNFIVGNYISLHDYRFTESFKTANRWVLFDKKRDNTTLYRIDENENDGNSPLYVDDDLYFNIENNE